MSGLHRKFKQIVPVANMSLFYVPMSLSDSLSLSGSNHATHCMLYSTPDSNGISYALLQMRFDGLIGFVGGGVDVKDVIIYDIIDAMNRELEEEINYPFESLTQSEWICSHRDTDSPFVQHFFAKELSFEQLRQIGRIHIQAHHFPIESLGLIYVPLISSDLKSSDISERFLNNLMVQRFAGNGRQQFMETIRKRKLLSDKQIVDLEGISKSVDPLTNDTFHGTEVKALLTLSTQVLYYDEVVDVTYGLMMIRDNGLFDFVGTDFVDQRDKESMIRKINDSLKRDLGSYSEPIILSNEESNEFSFDNDLSHVFHIKLNGNQFTQIETNFTETENFNQTSFGIFRIPFEVKGRTQKANNYVNRFFNGFLNQNFVNNSKNQLKNIEKFQKTIYTETADKL